MGKEQESGIRAEVGGQPEPKPGNQLSFLRFPGMVIAVVGAIAGVNTLVDGVKKRIEDFQREMRRPWPPPG